MKKSEKIKYYYDNPCYCLSCGKIIEYDGVQPLHKALELKYCSRACLKNKNCTKRMFHFPFS